MNADELPPFRLAQLLRNLANALEQNHPIAVDIAAAGTLPEIDAALWFEHLRNGNLRCDFRPKPGQPPCTADGSVAVSNPDQQHDTVHVCCLHHLPHFLIPGQSRSASVSDNNPLLRHYVQSLQAAQRQLRQSHVYDPSLNRQTNVLKGHILRRLTPTKPSPGYRIHHQGDT